jgi:hypothetical protein
VKTSWIAAAALLALPMTTGGNVREPQNCRVEIVIQ